MKQHSDGGNTLTTATTRLHSKSLLPFLLLGLLLFVAAKFGGISGVLGSAGAAIIFAEFLFPPLNRFCPGIQGNHVPLP